MARPCLVLLAALGISAVVPTAARAAPPSSAMSNPELAPPQIPQKTRQVTQLYKCTGYYNSYDCTTQLYFNNCTQSITVSWGPLKLPGTLEWAKLHRNWCSITYDGAEFREEHKLEPEKCDGLMRLFASAFQGFPEIPWQDAVCTNFSTPDGILFESQHYTAPGRPDFFHNPLPNPDPEPQAIRLEDVRSCELHNPAKKKRYVRCPVLVPEVNSWLRKFLAFVDVGLVIQNTIKPREDTSGSDNYRPPDSGKKLNLQWRGSLMFGFTVGDATDYTVNGPSGSSAFSDSAHASLLFSGEVIMFTSQAFGLAAIVDFSEYNYPDLPSDEQLTLFIMPRFQKVFRDKISLWGGVAAGLVLIIPERAVTQTTPSGTTVQTFDNALGLGVSPRLGLDVRLGQSNWLGAELFYLAAFASQGITSTVTTNSPPTVTTLSQDLQRSWWGFAIKYGWEL